MILGGLEGHADPHSFKHGYINRNPPERQCFSLSRAPGEEPSVECPFIAVAGFGFPCSSSMSKIFGLSCLD